jgi:hypothetical protein
LNGFRGSPVAARDHTHVSHQVLGLVSGRQLPDRVCGCHRVQGRLGRRLDRAPQCGQTMPLPRRWAPSTAATRM